MLPTGIVIRRCFRIIGFLFRRTPLFALARILHLFRGTCGPDRIYRSDFPHIAHGTRTTAANALHGAHVAQLIFREELVQVNEDQQFLIAVAHALDEA